MASDPAEISHAAELVVGVDVEDVLDGHSSAEEEATDGVHDPLGLASRSRGLAGHLVRHELLTNRIDTHVKDEQRIFGRKQRGRAEVGDLGGLLVPPRVAALDKVDRVAGPLEHEDVLDDRAVLDGVVRELLDRDALAAAAALVGGDDDAGLAVVDTVAEGLGREAGEDDGVDGADAGAGEEGGDGLPGHGQVDRDGVALLDTPGLEHVCDAADFAEELAVADLGAFTGLISLVDDRGLENTVSRW